MYSVASILAFPSDFIRLRQFSYGVRNSEKVLKKFNTSLGDKYYHAEALNACKDYCVMAQKCWGCTLQCNVTCQWIAITALVQENKNSGSIQTELFLKPGSKT